MKMPPQILPVLSAEAMREADRFSIETLGIPGPVLMENAGRGVASAIEVALGALSGKRVWVFAGGGNNGGDGFVVARILGAHGAAVTVFLAVEPERLTPDAALNYRILQNTIALHPEGRISLKSGLLPEKGMAAPHCVVDALIGTGLNQELREPYLSAVQRIGLLDAPVFAIDVPTGLNSDTGRIMRAAVRADVTLTLGASKPGLLLGDGPSYAGKLLTLDIGIPDAVLHRCANDAGTGCAYQATDATVSRLLPVRDWRSHKYRVGALLMVAGSPGLTGAPQMAAGAAARSGAGAIICATPASVAPVLATRFVEQMTVALPEHAGKLDVRQALDRLKREESRARALLIGCGLGRSPEAAELVEGILTQTELPVVIDADGLNALQGKTEILSRRSNGRWVLTPHEGEFVRLAGDGVDMVDRVHLVQAHAAWWNCVLVLKGNPTLIGCPDGTVFINATGNPLLATAGSGDVLAGLCAGLLAQGLAAPEAALCAVHIGGAVADHYRDEVSSRGMTATDLIALIPTVLQKRFA